MIKIYLIFILTGIFVVRGEADFQIFVEILHRLLQPSTFQHIEGVTAEFALEKLFEGYIQIDSAACSPIADATFRDGERIERLNTIADEILQLDT
jgi:hypothetical protein